MVKITSGQDWTQDLIESTYLEIEEVAKEMGLDTFPNQLEIVNSEMMLDAYCSIGLPVFYNHWSFGQSFIAQKNAYQKGMQSLAYELVINSDPCVSYIMEGNTMLMQTLVMAHAAFGHNHFFKNNYLFKQWTDPQGIVDYLAYAKQYITECENIYGVDEVEHILDIAHSLRSHAVYKYGKPKPTTIDQDEEQRKQQEKKYQHILYEQQHRKEWWDTVPSMYESEEAQQDKSDLQPVLIPEHEQDNLLMFLSKNAPILKDWERNIFEIVSNIQQYLYPQSQTKLMNEGFACYIHYKIIHKLYEKGILDEGAMLEFYKEHTGVITQPSQHVINPYALGFAMFQDIERIVTNPTKEDKSFFRNQSWVGCGDPMSVILNIVENYRDFSFIQQFLSPKLIREFKLFSLKNDAAADYYIVEEIHNDSGYKQLIDKLSKQYLHDFYIPQIKVLSIDYWNTRTLHLEHQAISEVPLNYEESATVLKYIAMAWKYPVTLTTISFETEQIVSIMSLDLKKNPEPKVQIFV